MEGASKITYTLLWQFFDTSKFNRNIYYLLLYSNIFQGHFKIGRALPQLHKNCETFYIQVSCCKNSFWSIWGACTNIIKKDCIHDALIYIYEPKNTKNNLTGSQQIADKVFFSIIEYLPLVAEQCFIVDSYFKLSSFLPYVLNYDD